MEDILRVGEFPGCDRAPTESPGVPPNHPVGGGQGPHLGIPHPMVRHASVEKHHRASGACLVVPDDGSGALDGALTPFDGHLHFLRSR